MNIGNHFCSTACSRHRERRVRDHLLNRLNARNRLLRKWKAEGYGTEQLAVYVNRASTHSLQDAGLLQRPTAQSSQYDALLWCEILEYAEDLALKIFDAIVMEDSAAHAAHSGLDILEMEEVL